MYEAMNQSVPDVAEYLKRLGLDRAPSIDPNGLNDLIWRHQTHVPFENLNTSYLHLPVDLDIPALYDKLVAKRRGGYCFELNALFARLLTDLGFDARQVSCRVVRGRDFLPPCLHEAVVVSLRGRVYFCDVGFGGPMPGGAVPIEDGFSGDIRGETFHIDRFDDHWWTLSRTDASGAREALLQFNTFPQLPQEFLTMNYRLSTDPESVFVRQLMVNLRTDRGSASISGQTLTLREDGRVHTETLPDDGSLLAALDRHFGIVISRE